MLTLVAGSDQYLIKEAVASLIGAIKKQHGGNVSITSVNADEQNSIDLLGSPLKYKSFLDTYTVVVGRGFSEDDILKTAKTLSIAERKDATLVVAWPKKPTVKLARMATSISLCEPLIGAQQTSWIRKFCADRSCSIEPKAMAVMVKLFNETWQIASELGKLCAWAGTGGTITQEIVRSMAPASFSQDQWAISNAISAGNKRDAIKSLWYGLATGVDPFQTLGSVASSIRTLLWIRSLTDNGMPVGRIATHTGLHPYVVTKSLQGARSYDPASLTKSLSMLGDLDVDAKSGNADVVDGLFKILLAI